MEMSEIEREDILAQRQEEMQRIQDKRNLDAMLRDRSGGGGDDNVAKAAKRESQRTTMACMLIPLTSPRTARSTRCNKGEVQEVGRTQSKTESQGRQEAGKCVSSLIAAALYSVL